MTLQEMVARVMRAIPGVAPGVIGELDVIDMLNEAQKHLSRLVSRFVVSEFELEADYNIVPMPTDLLTLISVHWKSDSVERELYPSPERLPVENVYSINEPKLYYVKAERVIVQPTPLVDGTVSIAYVPTPTAMSKDTDTPDLKDSEGYLIAYALHRLHLEAGSPQLQLWELEKMKEEHTFIQTSDQNYSNPIQLDMNW